MTHLPGGIADPNKRPLFCYAHYEGADCRRDPDAKCRHCGHSFCADHIVSHLEQKHQVSSPLGDLVMACRAALVDLSGDELYYLHKETCRTLAGAIGRVTSRS